MNSSYAYAEVLEVLENMEEIYVQKVPTKFVDFLKENASKDYQKHIVISKSLEDQNLNAETLNILALINLKYWVESEEHKQELLARYKENEKRKLERLSEHFDSSIIFDKSKSENTNNICSIKNEETSSEVEKNIGKIDAIKSTTFEKGEVSNNLPVEKKSIFRKIIDFLKSKIFEN